MHWDLLSGHISFCLKYMVRCPAKQPVTFLGILGDFSLHKSRLKAPVPSAAGLQVRASILFPFSDSFVRISTKFENLSGVCTDTCHAVQQVI